MFFESKTETSLKTLIFKFNFVICSNLYMNSIFLHSGRKASINFKFQVPIS